MHITTLMLVLVLLPACGQKGPLYLPQDQETEASSDAKDAAPPNSRTSARTEQLQQTDVHTARDRAMSLIVPTIAMASSPRDRSQNQGEASAMLEQAFEVAAQAKLAREAEECPVRDASPEVRGNGWRDRLTAKTNELSLSPNCSPQNSPRTSPILSPRK